MTDKQIKKELLENLIGNYFEQSDALHDTIDNLSSISESRIVSIFNQMDIEGELDQFENDVQNLIIQYCQED